MSATLNQQSLDHNIMQLDVAMNPDVIALLERDANIINTNSSLHLYCRHHRGNHQFTVRQVERLVYTLHGSLADAALDSPADDGAMTPDDVLDICIKELLGWGEDSEMYYEHVDSLLDARIVGSLVIE